MSEERKDKDNCEWCNSYGHVHACGNEQGGLTYICDTCLSQHQSELYEEEFGEDYDENY